MARNYSYEIKHYGGAYLREPMRACAAKDVETTLVKAARYVGVADPVIVPVDGGDVYAYASQEDADADRDGTGDEGPVLVARLVRSEEDDDDDYRGISGAIVGRP